jgi:NAD(P)-dependent dehydrogenase (short-subunit alcohol dehydrogenase family)
VTGAAGLLGYEFADALLEAGAKVCLLDINDKALRSREKRLTKKYHERCLGIQADITSEESLYQARAVILRYFGRIDVLINSAANDPKVEKGKKSNFSRFENFSIEQWEEDFAVGLKGSFLCCKIFGASMAKQRSGVIVNIASDLSVIGPDQRLYRQAGLKEESQPVKPVTYSIIKTGLLGLTRYLATYWAHRNVRINALSPGGIYTGQPREFVKRLTNLIPMGRMAEISEYRKAIVFLCSDSSKYMTGQNLIMDGGRSVW